MINQDHFQLLGLPQRFETDAGALERGFRAIQSSVHPDRFVRAMDAERRMAMQLSTQVNEAYRILSDPAQRALYLCRLKGVTVDTDRGIGLRPQFLEQQMAWRERLDEVRDDADALRALGEQLALAQAARIAEVGDAIDRAGDFAKAAELAREMLFIEKFRHSMEMAVRAQ
jgi:molecular chaperone HscB